MSTTINADTSISDVSPAIANAAANVAALPEADPCTVVIFGASGDLAKRKLLPALFNLACAGSLQCKRNQFTILGIGRTPMSDEAFRDAMHEFMLTAKDVADFTEEGWKEFANRIHYMVGDPNDNGSHEELANQLEALANEKGASRNCLFYLSTPPSATAAIIKGLGSAGLNEETDGWRRVIIEKPFGRDLTSARELNAVVGSVFQEHQTYRIDHYLGKETVQNILVFRFGNSLFEPIWNRNYIDHVEITAAEVLGIENRAGYYEESGALRDMVANHLLQLVTLTAMEPPVAFDADSVREEKVQVLRSMRPMTPDEIKQRTVRAQYSNGEKKSEQLASYLEEKGVKSDSKTETYAAVKFMIDNWRWGGVPFYVRTGKRLASHITEIRVHMKRTPQALFSGDEHDIAPNVIIMQIQPDEGISVNFVAKRPGTEMHASTVQMNFRYAQGFGTRSPAAYETLLLDAMQGDATLFTRADEVEYAWRLITPIEEAWASDSFPLAHYAANSAGPAESNSMLAREGHEWHDLEK
ncbi:MAG: glucose-6-phosphate dehydrogenase [Pyrinomonadaceae bacterium MAG19_C2-C3]|nr:glucose-6-phosphate dehydrogenase [Pyrinomonadaceae bacterium MAG19_C2-C3]